MNNVSERDKKIQRQYPISEREIRRRGDKLGREREIIFFEYWPKLCDKLR
jgi:hypothetical protein